jgi:FdhD protein
VSHETTQQLAAVDETPVWLEVNGRPAVTWMCTPDQLEELVVGWLHGEGYIRSVADVLSLRPCATDLGFWAQVPPENLAAVAADDRRRVLASGCGAVSVAIADPASVPAAPVRGAPPAVETMRALFKAMFARGRRYHETGGIHAAALTDGHTVIAHAEDVGRHNAVDKVIGTVLLARRDPAGLGMLVTGRISAELAFKAVRAGLVWVATVSVPTTLAVLIAARAGVALVGRAVSGAPQVHLHDAGVPARETP